MQGNKISKSYYNIDSSVTVTARESYTVSQNNISQTSTNLNRDTRSLFSLVSLTIPEIYDCVRDEYIGEINTYSDEDG